MKWAAAFALALGLTGCIEYSDGSRVGYVTKFSHKGLVWKSWECEMNLGGMREKRDSKDGSVSYVANLWFCAIDNHASRGEDIAGLCGKIGKAMNEGRRVRVFYKEEVATAPWRSGSSCLIQSVEFLD